MKLKLVFFILFFCCFPGLRSQVYLAGDSLACFYDYVPDATVSYTPLSGSGTNVQTYSLSVFGSAYDLEIKASTVGGLGGGSGSINFRPINPNVSIKFDRKDSVYNMSCPCWLSAKVAKKQFLNDTINTTYAKWDSVGLSLTAFWWIGGGPNLSVTDWVGGSDKYVGLRYKNGSSIDYAWIRVYLPTANKIIIKEYASSKGFAPPAPVNTTPALNRLICNGKSATLTANGNAISWYSSDTSASVIATGSVFVSAPLTTSASSTYTFYAGQSGCMAGIRTPITVTVIPSPTVGVYSTSVTICPGDTCILTGTGANTFTWSTSQTTNTIAISPTVSTAYTVTGTDWTYGCTNDYVYLQTVVSCVGIEEFQVEKFMMYPNPFNKDIFLENLEYNKIQLFDCLSREINIIPENEGSKIKLSLDSELPKGVYYLKISIKNEIFSIKLIKA